MRSQRQWFAAAYTGNEEALRNLVGEYARSRDPDGATALMIVAKQGNASCAELLVQHEWGEALSGKTALSMAAERDHVSVCRVLAPYESRSSHYTADTDPLTLSIRNLAYDSFEFLLSTVPTYHTYNGCLMLNELTTTKCKQMIKLFLESAQNLHPLEIDIAVEIFDKSSDRDKELRELLVAHKETLSSSSKSPLLASGCQECHQKNVKLAAMKAVMGLNDSLLDDSEHSEQSLSARLVDAHRQIEQLQAQIHEKDAVIRAYESGATPLNLFAGTDGANFTNFQFTKDGFDSLKAKLNTLTANFDHVAKILLTSHESQMACILRALRHISLDQKKLASPLHGDAASEMIRQAPDDTLDESIAGNETPLMRAISTAQLHLVRKHLLRYAGMASSEGETALMRAAILRNLDSALLLAGREAGMKNNYGITALMIVARTGWNCKSLIDILLPREKRARDITGRSALIHAVEHGNYDIAAILASEERGIQDNNGNTALFVLSGSRSALDSQDLLKKLLPAELKMKNSKGETCLFTAIKHNNLPLATLLLKALKPPPPQSATVSQKNSRTELMVASELNDIDGVYCLKAYQAGLTDERGRTALMLALERGNIDVATILVTCEAGIVDAKGSTALMRCCAMPRKSTSKEHQIEALGKTLSMQKGEVGVVNAEGFCALSIAIETGRTALAHMLYEREKDCLSKSGLTPLMIAAAMNKASDISKNAQTYAKKKSKSGKIAIVYALMHGNFKLAETLRPLELSEAYSPDKTGNRRTELMQAAIDGDLLTAFIMIPHQAKLQDQDGRTALMYAAERNECAMIALLTPHEKRIEAGSKLYNWTAIFFAAWKGHTEAVQMLLDAEGDHMKADNFTPLMQAASEGHMDVVRILAPKQAGIRTNGCGNKLALHYAIWGGNIECIDALFAAEGGYVTEEDNLMACNESHNIKARVAILLCCYAPRHARTGSIVAS